MCIFRGAWTVPNASVSEQEKKGRKTEERRSKDQRLGRARQMLGRSNR